MQQFLKFRSLGRLIPVVCKNMAILAAVAAVMVVPANSLMAQDGWGTLKGSIFVDGKVPAAKELKVDKDEAVCLADGTKITDQSLLLGKDNQLQGVFIYMSLKRKEKAPVHPDLKDPSSKKVVLDNKKCIFVPATVAVRTGQVLTLKNSDAAGHNCNIKGFSNQKNVSLPKNDSLDVKFKKAEKVPAKVVCDIHPWMQAHLLVCDHPYFAVTGNDGSFEIKKIPAGKWKFRFWHSRSGYMKKMTKDGKSVASRRGEVTVEIKDGETVDLGKLMIKASALKSK